MVNQVIVNDCSAIAEDIHVIINPFDLSDHSTLEMFLDEATWDSRRSQIETAAACGSISAAYMVHPGTTMNATCRTLEEPYGRKANNHEMKKRVRIDTCLALRILQLIGIFTSCCIPWLLITPQVSSSTFSILNLPDFEEIRKRHFTASRAIDDNLSFD